MADLATLGHFLPYLLRHRLLAVLWPSSRGERAAALGLLGLLVLYGIGFGFLLNHEDPHAASAILPTLLVSLNAAWLFSTLLVDFFPTLRPVTRPLPEHYPVSERQNVVTAFLLDLLTLRRLLLVAGLLAALLVAPRHALVPGFSLLLVLGASVLSFNVRLLVALRRWRSPLMLGHAGSLGLMGWWLAHPTAPYYTQLGVGMALLPWLLGAAQLYWLGPFFSVRYLPATAAAPPTGVLSRLPPEWQVYGRKAARPLGMGLFLKVILLVFASSQLASSGKESNFGLFYFTFLPLISFNYVNNNLFGFLRALTANELLRLGLTPRLLALYARLVLPVVLADCLVSAVLLVALFPASRWPLLWLLPLSVPTFASLGLWGSLYLAKPVAEQINFSNMRRNVSLAINLISIALAFALYLTPWWWLRLALAVVATASAAWPLRQVRQNDGELRRRLWQGIGA